MMANGNRGFAVPPPPPPRPPVVPPYAESIYNIVTRRLRLANTIFGDRVKLVLRQEDIEHWSNLALPYLLVVPTQTRAPRELDVDYMSFVNPRVLTLIAQFDGRGSEKEYMAVNDIDTAEQQLIFVLANWQPATEHSQYKPTLYGGMRIQGTRAPDVKVTYLFTLNEQVVLPDEAPLFPGEWGADALAPVVLDGIHVNVLDPCCNMPCMIIPPLGPDFFVTGGGCPCPQPPDPCAPPPCPPILGANDNHAAP